MAIDIQDHGKNNRITIANQENLSGKIVVNGNNNEISIGAGTRGAINLSAIEDCKIEIGERCFFNGITVSAHRQGSILLGNNISAMLKFQISANEPSAISIGHFCLFATGVIVASSDSHSLFDLATGQRINPAKDIVIGPNVWVGYEAYINKGAKIGSGSMIGARSVVVGDIPSNTLAAGVPAKVLKTGIAWDRRLLDTMPDDSPSLLFL